MEGGGGESGPSGKKNTFVNHSPSLPNQIIFQAPFKAFNNEAHAITMQELQTGRLANTQLVRVLQSAYGFLATFLEGESRKNELYAALHVPFFQTQVGLKPKGDVLSKTQLSFLNFLTTFTSTH